MDTVVGENGDDNGAGLSTNQHPILSKISAEVGAGREQIPYLFALLIAVAESDFRQPVCLIVPNASAIANLTAIMLSLHKINSAVQQISDQTCAIEPGTRVRVLPSGYVYEFLGPMPGYPQFLKLGIMNTKGGSRTLPADEFGRLQPTDAVRPLGDGKCDLGSFQKSPLDLLADTTFGGNVVSFSNKVVLFGYRTTFQKIINQSKLVPRVAYDFPTIEEFFPWGRLKGDGSPIILNPPSSHGAPLVAVSSELENVVHACEAAAPFSMNVLADGASSLANNLQHFDRIAERQSLLVFCKPHDREKAKILHERGAVMWELHADDAAPKSMRRAASRKSMIGRTLHQLDVFDRLTLKRITCTSTDVDAIAAALESASGLEADEDESFHVDKVLRAGFELLNLVSEFFGDATQQELRLLQNKLAALRTTLTTSSIWIGTEHQKLLSSAIEAFGKLLASPNESLGTEKGALIEEMLGDRRGLENTAIVTKSEAGTERIKRLIGEHGELSVFPASSVPDQTFSRLILVSWPGRYMAAKLFNSALAPDIQMIGYPFESRWFNGLVSRFDAEVMAGNISAEMRSRILGGTVHVGNNPNWKRRAGETPRGLNGEDPIEIDRASAVMDFEARLRELRPELAQQSDGEPREATFVRFVGSSSAYFTEWHSMPWLNPLFGEGTGTKGVPVRYVNQMAQGDYLLFREGAGKDVVRFVAESMVGEEKYKKARDIADLWRPALSSLSDDPWTVWRKLAEHGLKKSEAAVRGWLLDPNRIGPGNREDYEIIANVTSCRDFSIRWNDVWNAVRKVRRLHIRSGHQLSELLLKNLPNHIDEIEAHETRLDLGFGQVWVVQVDYIASKSEQVSSTIVNRLLWEGGIPPVRLTRRDLEELGLA